MANNFLGLEAVAFDVCHKALWPASLTRRNNRPRKGQIMLGERLFNDMKKMAGLLVIIMLSTHALWGDHVNRDSKEPASPQDLTSMGLEDLMKIKVDTVYAASKHSQKVAEAPSSVTVVTAEQIRRYRISRSGGCVAECQRLLYLVLPLFSLCRGPGFFAAGRLQL